MPTVLQPANVRQMLDIKDNVAKLPGQLYMLGAHGRAAGCAELEALCYDIADQLIVARIQLDKALLMAAANKPPKEEN